MARKASGWEREERGSEERTEGREEVWEGRRADGTSEQANKGVRLRVVGTGEQTGRPGSNSPEGSESCRGSQGQGGCAASWRPRQLRLAAPGLSGAPGTWSCGLGGAIVGEPGRTSSRRVPSSHPQRAETVRPRSVPQRATKRNDGPSRAARIGQRSLWDLRSPTRDRTRGPGSESTKA